MAAIKTPTEILQLAKIATYLSFNDRANKNFLRGSDIDYRLPIMISAERLCVEWTYDTNPVDSTLRSTSSYLYDLLGIYALQAQNILNNLAGTVPVVSGPSNESVNVGDNATFTISVTSSSSYTIAWFRNGVLIPEQTGLSYTLNSAQLSDSGAVFMAVVTNSTGSANSANATLTVTQTIVGYLYYTSTNPLPTLQASQDPFSYQSSYSITHNQPISIALSSAAANNQFLVIKVPVTESSKTTWFNSSLNNGQIPDFIFNSPISFGGFTYYSTVQSSYDSTQPLILS